MSSSHAPKVRERKDALRRAYAEQLPTRVRRVEALLREIARERASASSMRALESELHSLAGSSQALGLEAFADAARSFELFVRSQTFDVRAHSRAVEGRFTEHLQHLREACLEASRGVIVEVDGADSTELPGEERVSRVLYFLGSTDTVAHDLGFELGCFGLALRWFRDCDRLLLAMDEATPAAVMVDAEDFEHGLDQIRQIAEVRDGRATPTQVFVLSPRSDLASRLAAVQAGADDYFLRPIEIRRLVDRLDRELSPSSTDPYRILLVPADYASGLDYALTLQRAGMSVAMAEEPGEVWRQLVDFKPEAVVISLALEEIAGQHLAAVIRQQDAYVSVPMVFLSGGSNLDSRLTAVRSEADDLLTEPIEPGYLVTTLCHHVQRSRALRRFVATDSLTGLLSHSAFVERCDVEIERARRGLYELSYAIIDVDYLGSINETFGHLSGDAVLANLARLLERRLRGADLVGRWGGDELVVVLPETNGANALRVLDHVREMFNGIVHRSGDSEFSPTFSCGIATLGEHDSAEVLHQTARAMLRSARIQGSNRVVLAR